MIITCGIDHLIRNIGLALSVTFIVPLIGAIAGTILANLLALPTRQKGDGVAK